MALVIAAGLTALEYTGEEPMTPRLLRCEVKKGDTLVCPDMEAVYLKRTKLFVDVGKAEQEAKAKADEEAKAKVKEQRNN